MSDKPEHCRLCMAPVLAFRLCSEHMTAENLNMCALDDCHRPSAPKSDYCPVHKSIDKITKPTR